MLSHEQSQPRPRPPQHLRQATASQSPHGRRSMAGCRLGPWGDGAVRKTEEQPGLSPTPPRPLAHPLTPPIARLSCRWAAGQQGSRPNVARHGGPSREPPGSAHGCPRLQAAGTGGKCSAVHHAGCRTVPSSDFCFQARRRVAGLSFFCSIYQDRRHKMRTSAP